MDYHSNFQSLVDTVRGSSSGIFFSCPTHYKQIGSSEFCMRSIWWRILLGVLPKDEWVPSLRKQRQEFEALRVKFFVTPSEDSEDLSLNNPLSQDSQSSWNQYFSDRELKRLIRQDVVRTFPDEKYFHSTFVQETLVNVLFVFARQHTEIAFKQGLHEILAPIILVLQTDYDDFNRAGKESTDSSLREVLDKSYMEHDAYHLFCGIMKRIGKWYLSKEDPPPSAALRKSLQQSKHLQQLLHSQPFADESSAQSQVSSPSEMSPLLERINHIHSEVLPSFYPQLSKHLNELDIPPQVYCIRWLRLLFGREVSLSSLLVLWDALFWCSTHTDLPLADHFAVALLGSVESELLTSDNISCLNILMRFPPPEDVHQLLSVAVSRLTNASSVRSKMAVIASQRSRHNSADELERKHSTNSNSSLPPPHTLHSPRPTTLPEPLSHNKTVVHKSNVLSNQTNAANHPIGIQRANSSSAQRVQNVNPQSRSRSQVTRCSSESSTLNTRHPSMSPRRPLTNHVDSIKETSNGETSSKSNILNFVKFGTVKYSKPREEQKILTASPKQMRVMSGVNRTQSSNVLPVTKQRELAEKLQNIAGEFNGHLSVLSQKHKDLNIDEDMFIRVTMERLLTVSNSLQSVADSLSVTNGAVTLSSDAVNLPSDAVTLPRNAVNISANPVTCAKANDAVLSHPLMLSPE